MGSEDTELIERQRESRVLSLHLYQLAKRTDGEHRATTCRSSRTSHFVPCWARSVSASRRYVWCHFRFLCGKLETSCACRGSCGCPNRIASSCCCIACGGQPRGPLALRATRVRPEFQ